MARLAELETRLWTPDEVGARYGLALKTLRNWRASGIGPGYIRVGRRVLYPESELAHFEANRRRSGAA
jgi:hypothetical protein